MSSQWGDSRYPPFASNYGPPPPSSHPGPPFDPKRPPYAQYPVGGFYNPAILAQRQQLQSYPQRPPLNPIPHTLRPGAPGTPSPPVANFRSGSGDLGADLFFQDSPAFPTPSFPAPHVVHPPLPTHPQHAYSAPAPPLPRKPDFSQPPLPPKPFVSSPPGTLPQLDVYHKHVDPRQDRTAQPPPPPKIYTDVRSYSDVSDHKSSISGTDTKASTPSLPRRETTDEDEELKRVLAQSARDAEEARRREEEELSRALAESMTIQPRRPPPLKLPALHIANNNGEASSSKLPVYQSLAPPSAPLSALPSPVKTASPVSIYDPDRKSPLRSSPPTLSAAIPSSSSHFESDEQYARRLGEEEQREVDQIHATERAREASQSASQAKLQEASLPQYEEVVSSASSASHHSDVHSAKASTPIKPLTPATPADDKTFLMRQAFPSVPQHEHLERSTSANAVPQVLSSVQLETRANRSQSFGAFATKPPAARDSLSPPPQLATKKSMGSLPSVKERSDSSDVNSKSSSKNSDSPIPPLPDTPMTANQFIDSELLRGVTIGFTPPVMSPALTPMPGPIPNVIALPYGRAPPLHFKAPNWRDMLRLMARLSNTRLEASIEAQALVKTAMLLRVVVNFVKVHQSSQAWHVILYMTIDLPIPDDHRYKSRNQNDPALLPYSYTLSPTPAYLREAADGPMSKWYSIPATSQTPYRTLPIYMPDLATYLMSALEDSKSAIHDRSSGQGRLAKAVDTFYPNQSLDDDDPEERRGFSERFGRLFGRGTRSSRPANDDRSALVTPFYADNFGR